MSDPVTNMEIEDVLSSIRRLVAQDGGAGQAMTATSATNSAATTSAAAKEQADQIDSVDSIEEPEDDASEGNVSNALLLTHALRVVEPETKSEPEQPSDALLLSEDLVVVEPTSEAPDAGPCEEQAHDIAQDDACDEQETESEAVETVVEAVDAAETQEADDVQENTDVQGHAPQAAELIVDVERALPEETLQLPETETETEVEDAEASDHSDRLRDEELELLPEADAVPLEQKIAELEALIGGSDDQWEPDGNEVDANDPAQALPWADDAPSEDLKVHRAQTIVPPVESVDPEAQTEPAAHSQTRTDADMLRSVVREALHDEMGAMERDWSEARHDHVEVPVLDEDGLRDLVADIVRQELQGALGERITRNVRKLVRREIYRAMTTNELD